MGWAKPLINTGYTVTLQVKDPQQVFDEIVLSQLQAQFKTDGEIPSSDFVNALYQIFVLGEMYGTISTSLAQEIPIPKELWENSTVQQFVMGDTDNTVTVGTSIDTNGEINSSKASVILLP